MPLWCSSMIEILEIMVSQNESNVFSMFQLSFYIGMVEMMPPLKLALRKKTGNLTATPQGC